MSSITALKIGNSVRVKPGTKDPDSHIELGGWQGRVYEIDRNNNLILIHWDSITLKEMNPEWIVSSEKEGLDWSAMHLAATDVETVEQRDAIKDAQAQKILLERIHRWDYLGKQGRRINKILDDIFDDDSLEAFESWKKYFIGNGHFPFEAVIDESADGSPLHVGDRVTIEKVTEVIDDYGVFVEVSSNGHRYDYPLSDLRITDAKNPLKQAVEDYRDWFANK